MRFRYLSLPTALPIYSLRGQQTRHRPVVPIHVISPQMLPPFDACIDCAADDTLFPERFARRLGIDLANAPRGDVRPTGKTIFAVMYAHVTLFLSDGFETLEWDAIVGFTPAPLRWPLLGHAGFLEFLDVELRGARRELVLVPGASFSGRHIIHQLPP